MESSKQDFQYNLPNFKENVENLAKTAKEKELKVLDKKDELIKHAQSLISRLQTIYGNIFSIVDTDILSNDEKILKLKSLPKEFQEIKNYKKSLLEYQRGIDTTQKVLDPTAYDELAKGSAQNLYNSFNETNKPLDPSKNTDL
jgi:hypothetical protein